MGQGLDIIVAAYEALFALHAIAARATDQQVFIYIWIATKAVMRYNNGEGPGQGDTAEADGPGRSVCLRRPSIYATVLYRVNIKVNLQVGPRPIKISWNLVVL